MGLTPVGCDAFMKGPQLLASSHCAPKSHPSSDTGEENNESSWADKCMNVALCLPSFNTSPISLCFMSPAPTQAPKAGYTASRELLNWLTPNMENGSVLRPEQRTHSLLLTSQDYPQAKTYSLGQNKPGLISRALLSINKSEN